MDTGAILAYDMTIECIFAKLSYLIGKNYSVPKIQRMMMQSLKGELTDQKKMNNNYTLKNSKMVQAVAKILNVSDQDEIKQINQTLSPLLVNAVASTGNLQLMVKMAEEGADFGLVDYRGRGPIHVAAISGDTDIVKFLIDQGVNLDHVDQTGNSALYLACYHRNFEVADLLIKRGATVQVPVTTLAR